MRIENSEEENCSNKDIEIPIPLEALKFLMNSKIEFNANKFK